MSFDNYKATYLRNWQRMQIRSSHGARTRDYAYKCLAGKKRYLEVERRTGVPWWFVALCHYRENSEFKFDRYLGNGQLISQRTTIVPKGRGPFRTFEDGAYDALKLQGFVGTKDWSLARASYRLEAFNGFGYRRFGVNSPYLYSGSTLYGPPEEKGGKFVRDHVFDPAVVDKQIGTLTILKRLVEADKSISIDGIPQRRDQDDLLERGVYWAQVTLNKLGHQPSLVEDGILGPMTKMAISQYQQELPEVPDTGLLDEATIASLEEAAKTNVRLTVASRDLLTSLYG